MRFPSTERLVVTATKPTQGVKIKAVDTMKAIFATIFNPSLAGSLLEIREESPAHQEIDTHQRRRGPAQIHRIEQHSH